MKCKKCGRKAVIKLKQYGMSLCENCYPQFYVDLVEKSIKRFKIIRKGERLLAAISGGKDSVAMVSVMKKLSKTINFEIEALYIDLGIAKYSEESKKIVKDLSTILNIPLNVVELREYGF